jgi:hypothetical protein
MKQERVKKDQEVFLKTFLVSLCLGGEKPFNIFKRKGRKVLETFF